MMKIQILIWQSILKAYLRGVWDSLNGVWLIVIVIRDTYSSTALQNEKQDSELEESSSSSNNTHTSKRSTRRSTHANKRELNKLKEYVCYRNWFAWSFIQHNWCSTFFFLSLFPSYFFNNRESNLLKRVFQCCLLNGGFFGLSILLFEYALLPIIRMFLSWMFTQNPGSGAIIGNYIVTFLSILFGMIWVMPLFILSKIVNSLWFQVGEMLGIISSRRENYIKQFSCYFSLGYCRFSVQIP